MKKQTHVLLVAAFSVVSSAFGTPTGLNNIPTADTVPHRTVAVQFAAAQWQRLPFRHRPDPEGL